MRWAVSLLVDAVGCRSPLVGAMGCMSLLVDAVGCNSPLVGTVGCSKSVGRRGGL